MGKTVNQSERTAVQQLSKWVQLLPADVLADVPTDLEAIGLLWGVEKVIQRKLDVAGLLRPLDGGGSVIFLNEDDSPARRRFSWAHELGHVIMPRSEGIRTFCRKLNQPDQSLERSCDIITSPSKRREWGKL